MSSVGWKDASRVNWHSEAGSGSEFPGIERVQLGAILRMKRRGVA